MNNDLIKTLKGLKKIAPDAGYSARSRHMLLTEINSNKATALKRASFGDALAIVYARKYAFIAAALFVVLIVSGSSIYVKNQVNERNFVAKANEVNASIKVKLEEIKYILGNEYIDYNTSVVIQSMLTEAVKNLEEASKENNNDKSLEKIKTAQELFAKIDALLKD